MTDYKEILRLKSMNYSLRACLVSIENNTDKGKRKELKRILKKSLTVFSKPTTFIKLAKGAFHNPTLGKNSKSM